ncbi:MAG: hypothetical protein U0872_11515 [Planctomycetaceae bacterium]
MQRSFTNHFPDRTWVTIVYWPLAVPIYLIWSRGWYGMAIAVMLALFAAGVALRYWRMIFAVSLRL